MSNTVAMRIYVVTYIASENYMSGGPIGAFHDQQQALDFAKEAAEETLANLDGVEADIQHEDNGSYFETDEDSYSFSVDHVDVR